MTVIKINAITVPAESGDELAKRFAARAGAVDGQEGFEGFELLRPTDERTTWLVVTRWRDDEAFQAWVNSPAFGRGHQGPAAGAEGAPAGHGHGAGQGEGAGHGHGHGAGPGEGAGHGHGHGGPAPLAMSSELWSYEVAETGSPR